MPKKEYLIGKLKGQIEDWENEVNRLECEIDDTSKADVKKECNKKIAQLQHNIVEANQKIRDMDGRGFRITWGNR